MSEMVQQLRTRRGNLWEQMKALADVATDENRAFSGEEQGSWDALNEELGKLDERIKSAMDTEEREKKATEQFDRLTSGITGRSTDTGRQPETRTGDQLVASASDRELDQQLRQLGLGEIRRVEVGLPSAMERRALVESRVGLTTASSPAPNTFIGQLYQYLVDTSSLRQANPRVITTSSGEELTLPVATADGQASWTAQATAITESDPSFSSVTLSAFKVANIINVSRELIDDAGFDLLGYLAEQAGRSIGVTTNAAYVNGDGTGKPTGLLQSSLTATVLAAHAITGDDLITLFHAVQPMYRGDASWLMNDAILAAVRKLKDTTGQYLWQPGLQAGEPDRLLGKPVLANPSMPDDLSATNSFVTAFGNFSGYWVRDVTPLRFDRSDDFKFDSDVVSFRVIYRTDGKVGDPNAVRVLETPAT